MTEGSVQTRKKRTSSLRRRSKSQNRTPVQYKSEREQHLQFLETRLDKAKDARDNYLSHLKQKYPDWRQSTPNLMKSPPPYQSHILLPGQVPEYSNLLESFNYPLGTSISRVPRTSMMNELETSKYFWGRGSSPIGSKLTESYQSMLPMSNLIPSSSIYLDADLPGVLSKLEEIKVNLKELREQRLTMPTMEYFRIHAPDLKSQFKPENPQPLPRSSYYGSPEKADLPSLAEIRARILNMDLNIEMRTREILDEAYKRQAKVMQRREIPANRDPTEGMPGWLKNTENIIEKMEKEEERELEEILKTNKKPDNIQEKSKEENNQTTISKQSEDGRGDSVAIAPTRTIVFNTSKPLTSSVKNEIDNPVSEALTTGQEKPNLTSQQVSKATSQETSKTSAFAQLSPPIPPKTESSSYSKMLELLKSSSKNASSPSSSSEDEFQIKPRTQPTASSIIRTTETVQEKPKIDFGRNLFGSNFGAGTNLGAKMQPSAGKDDSDDDFFN